MNQDLNALHDLLVELHDTLYQMMDTAPDSDTMDAITTEMREVRHRIDIVQSLLFRQTSDRLSDYLKQISDADSDLSDALKTATTATAIIKGVGKFLTLVDKTLDFAKTLAV